MTEQPNSTPVISKVYVLSLRLGIYAGVTFLSVLSRVFPLSTLMCAVVVVGYTGYLIIDTLKDITLLRAENKSANPWLAVIHGNAQDFFYLMASLIVGFMFL